MPKPRLYAVTVEYQVLVVAESEEEAERFVEQTNESEFSKERELGSFYANEPRTLSPKERVDTPWLTGDIEDERATWTVLQWLEARDG